MDAVIREGFEQVGVLAKPTHPQYLHTLHVHNPGEQPRIGRFSRPPAGPGEPVNREPDKCAAIGWFTLDGGLPDTMIPNPKAGILAYRAGIPSASSAGRAPPHGRDQPPTHPRTPAQTT